MKRLLLIALALVVGCSHDATAPSLPIRADNLSLSVSFLKLIPTETVQLFIQHTSNGKEYTGNAVWSSSDEGVASVDQNGLVTAVAPGTATVRATNAAGTQDDGSAVVTVEPFLTTITPGEYPAGGGCDGPSACPGLTITGQPGAMVVTWFGLSGHESAQDLYQLDANGYAHGMLTYSYDLFPSGTPFYACLTTQAGAAPDSPPTSPLCVLAHIKP